MVMGSASIIIVTVDMDRGIVVCGQCINSFRCKIKIENNLLIKKVTMSISIFDIEYWCRVCLNVNETNISIFDEIQEFNMSISDLLVFYGEMTVNFLFSFFNPKL